MKKIGETENLNGTFDIKLCLLNRTQYRLCKSIEEIIDNEFMQINWILIGIQSCNETSLQFLQNLKYWIWKRKKYDEKEEQKIYELRKWDRFHPLFHLNFFPFLLNYWADFGDRLF